MDEIEKKRLVSFFGKDAGKRHLSLPDWWGAGGGLSPGILPNYETKPKYTHSFIIFNMSHLKLKL